MGKVTRRSERIRAISASIHHSFLKNCISYNSISITMNCPYMSLFSVSQHKVNDLTKMSSVL